MIKTNREVSITIQFDNKSLTLPVNPEKLTISDKASNSGIDILGLGKAARKGEPELITMNIESFFPAVNSYFYTGYTPQECINFINEIWHTENINNRVPKLITKGLDIDFNDFWFVIDNFNYTYEGGTFDIAYELSIKQYKPYGAKNVTFLTNGMATSRTVSVNSNLAPVTGESNNPTSELKTYKVQSGDTLWGITKRCTGNGNQWDALYQLNKQVIGDNPNSIKVGTLLTLPEGWNAPKASTKKATNKAKSTAIQSASKATNGSVQEATSAEITAADTIAAATKSYTFDEMMAQSNAKQPSTQIFDKAVEEKLKESPEYNLLGDRWITKLFRR